MALEKILRALGKRAPWLAVARPILKVAGFETTRGSQPSIDDALQAATDTVRNAKLRGLMSEHALAGEKLVRLVSVSTAERAQILAWVQAKRRHSNVLSDPFPGLAEDSQLPQFTAAAPTSLGYIQIGNASAAGYTAVRSYQAKVELNISDLVPSANDGYEHVFATKTVFWQTFDAVVVLPGRDYIALVTDLPRGIPEGFAKASQQFLESQLRNILARPVSAVNIWKAIAGLYSSNEGRLVDHGFVNNADAVKSHTARRGSGDLRSDPYDVAGAAAVGSDLATYRVAIAWDRQTTGGTSSTPELQLPGSARDLHACKLDHFIIRNSLNFSDLDFVVSKILVHI